MIRLFTILGIITALVLASWLIWQIRFRPIPAIPEKIAILDSLISTREKATKYADSAQIYQNRAATLEARYNSYPADTAFWDSLRAIHRRKVRDAVLAEIRDSLTRQPRKVRNFETPEP